MPKLEYSNAVPVINSREVTEFSDLLFFLMLRNISTKGWVFRGSAGVESIPGCIIASPSHPPESPTSVDYTDQDYVYNWTRDSAIAAIELANSLVLPSAYLSNYIDFSLKAQNSDINKVGFACYRLNATLRDGSLGEIKWSEQSDGPALQCLAVFSAWDKLSDATKKNAKTIVENNIRYLIDAYSKKTKNLWEETDGFSIFTRSVQLKCFKEAIRRSIFNLQDLSSAINNLDGQIWTHWDQDKKYLVSIIDAPPKDNRGAELNSDVIMAAIYGDLDCIDSRVLATASKLRRTFMDMYPINKNDKSQDIGPLIGRYPEDTYDGDLAEQPNEGHPWAPCTCNMAEYYYRVAKKLMDAGNFSVDDTNKSFYEDFGIAASTTIDNVRGMLVDAADSMLRAVIYHSDNLELSEQFDRYTGYEKSVRNLTWSYASYLSAIRARKAL